MRFVGTPEEPYRIQRKEILKNMRGSYFKYFIIPPMNLAGTLFDNCDFLDGVIEADMTDCSVDYIVSKNTDWTKAVMPAGLKPRTLTSCHDVVAAMLTQSLPNAASQEEAEAKQLAIDYIKSSYQTGWPDTLKALNDAGYPPSLVIGASENDFGKYPFMRQELTYVGKNPSIWHDMPPSFKESIDVEGTKNRKREKAAFDIAFDTDERSVLSARLAAELDKTDPELAPWRVQVFRADPLYMQATPERFITTDRYDWWRNV
jgi:hypothetical protein